MLKDDKLQNILGHFKKDFEGDFSAENLGMLHAWQQLFFFFFVWVTKCETSPLIFYYRGQIWWLWLFLANLPTFPSLVSSKDTGKASELCGD